MKQWKKKRGEHDVEIEATSSEHAVERVHRGTGLGDLQRAAGNHAMQQVLRPLGGAQKMEAEPSAANVGGEQALDEGRPLDSATRERVGQKMGADLGEVRIHNDAAAAESARRMNALAYTLGNHIVFGSGGFAPHTEQGQTLLAHELAHVVQQRRDPRPRIQRQPTPGTTDVDLEPVSEAEAERLKAGGLNLPKVSQGTYQAVGGSPYSQLMPGYSQWGESCGAASLVSALLIWDREHWDPAHPNSRAVEACDLVIADLETHGADAAERQATAHPIAECAGDHACSVAAWKAFRNARIADLTRIRNAARTPAAVVSESDYQQLGISLYFLWNEGKGGAGLGTKEIFNIQKSLGLNTGISAGIRDFDAIFTNFIVAGLAPDEMAQVFWYAGAGLVHHAFLIGRLSTGKWFLSDQGQAPAFQIQSDSAGDLHSSMRAATGTGSSWLFAGTVDEYLSKSGNVVPGYTGVQKLGSAGATHQAVQQTVAPGAALGQVDAGYMTIGDDITCGSFVGRTYTFDEAKAMLPAGAGGGLIVEMPTGVFTVYLTSAVSDANLNETSLDKSDSAGMLLGRHTFHHAWLILGNRNGMRRSWWQVY